MHQPTFNDLLLYGQHCAKDLKIKRHCGEVLGVEGLRKKRERTHGKGHQCGDLGWGEGKVRRWQKV